MNGRVSSVQIGEYAVQLHRQRKRSGLTTVSEQRFLLLGPSPTPGAFRPTVASGTLVGGAVYLDKGSMLDAEMVARIENAVSL